MLISTDTFELIDCYGTDEGHRVSTMHGSAVFMACGIVRDIPLLSLSEIYSFVFLPTDERTDKHIHTKGQ